MPAAGQATRQQGLIRGSMQPICQGAQQAIQLRLQVLRKALQSWLRHASRAPISQHMHQTSTGTLCPLQLTSASCIIQAVQGVVHKAGIP